MTSAVTSTRVSTKKNARRPDFWSISGGSGMSRCLSLPGAGAAVSIAGASAEPVG